MSRALSQIHPDTARPQPGFATRRIGTVNWLGVYTLYAKEVRRFIKVFLQTILAPAVTTILFLAIFMVALGGARRTVGDIAFSAFLAPGLIMMSIIQNSFANTSSSLMIAKIQGNIVDVLMPPLSAGELTVAYAAGGVSRGALVALAVAAPIFPFVDLTINHPWAVLYYGLSASLMLSLIGAMTGIWSDKFDHLSAVTNFVIMPLSFLSGTFYSIERLPEIWQTISRFNPFFYLIDGFRYGFIGHADGDLTIGVLTTLAANLALTIACYLMFRRGYKLKA